MPLEITSIKNPRIKLLSSLEKSRDRKETGLFVIEGVREVSLAQQSGFELVSLYICPQIFQQDELYPINLEEKDVLYLPQELFSKVAYRENTGGVLAIAKARANTLDEFPVKNGGLYLVLEKVEKPGNIGAMLRTADAAGLSGVIICDPATDFYNPNVVRSSVGCLFTVPIASATNSQVLGFLVEHGIDICVTSLTATKAYHQVNMTQATAIVMGSESEGVSDFWLQAPGEKVIIPMHGRIDSMNVSNAAAILIFEALRQRGI